MSIPRPQDSGRKEQVSLEAAASHILEECRLVLPGIQALFGFQLIAVFNDGFSRRLTHVQQYLHLAAILMVIAAIALVMAPAALHRQTAQQSVSERFIWLSSRLLYAGMFPLAFAISLELYLVGSVIGGEAWIGAALAALALAVFASLWIVMPLRERPRQG
jgi:uncharacterized protein DUF6328